MSELNEKLELINSNWVASGIAEFRDTPNISEIFEYIILTAEKSAKLEKDQRPIQEKWILGKGKKLNTRVNIDEVEIPEYLKYLSEGEILNYQLQVANGKNPEVTAALIQIERMLRLRHLHNDNFSSPLYKQENKNTAAYLTISLMDKLLRSISDGSYILERYEQIREKKRELLCKSVAINEYILKQKHDKTNYIYDNEEEYKEHLARYRIYNNFSTKEGNKAQYISEIKQLKTAITTEILKSREVSEKPMSLQKKISTS